MDTPKEYSDLDDIFAEELDPYEFDIGDKHYKIPLRFPLESEVGEINDALQELRAEVKQKGLTMETATDNDTSASIQYRIAWLSFKAIVDLPQTDDTRLHKLFLKMGGQNSPICRRAYQIVGIAKNDGGKGDDPT